MGSLVKDFLSPSLGVSSDRVYHVTVMPCYDKKLEASREDFYNDICKTRDVDCVISTGITHFYNMLIIIVFITISGEVEQMLLKENIKLNDLICTPLDSVIGTSDGSEVCSHAGGGSGGYLEHIIKYAAKEIHGLDINELKYKILRYTSVQYLYGMMSMFSHTETKTSKK
jgi:iron only hydrogenase large subunit-like protein